VSTLYLSEPYSVVKREGEALRVQIPAREGQAARVVRVPLIKVDQVVVFGNVTLTTPVVHHLLEQRIAVHYLSERGRSYGSVVPDPSKNAQLHLAQYALHCDRARRFALGRRIVGGKIANMRTLLLRYNRKLAAAAIDAAVIELRAQLRALERVPPPLGEAPAPAEDRMHGLGPLLGVEGAATGLYFGVFDRLVREPWSFPGRRRRPPTDPVNALLSFGYSVLANQATSLVCLVGLNPYIGVLHQPGYGKPALALDIIEEFRAVVVDSVVVSVLNNRMLKPDDFVEELGAYRLRDEARRRFLEQLEERLNEQIQHPVFGYRVTYRRCMELQIRLLGKAMTGEIADYPPFTVR
jgi:CRISPR-associated protein Cas1